VCCLFAWSADIFGNFGNLTCDKAIMVRHLTQISRDVSVTTS
jgi:hypothetical protein